MQEVGRGAGGAEGGGDLLGDKAAFADAEKEDAGMLLDGGDEGDGGGVKRVMHGSVEAVSQSGKGFGLDADEL